MYSRILRLQAAQNTVKRLVLFCISERKNTMFHRHVSMATLQREIREGIALQGFAIRHVSTSRTEPEFTYTVGLHLPGSTRPELFMSGLPLEARVQWMLHLGFLIQGPPPIETQQRMAKAQAVSIEALVFPKGGQVFQSGVRYPDLAGNGLPTCFGEVDQHYDENYFGQAIVFHRTEDFPVLQVVWPDTRGRFPFEASFERRFLPMQHLLFDPRRYLPLKDADLEQ